MKAKGLLFSFLFFIMLCSYPVFANGPYIGIEGGLAIPTSSDFVHSISTLVVVKGEAELDNGYAMGGIVGYRFSKFRVEGELVYRKNDFDQVTFSVPIIGSVSDEATGKVSATSLLLNAYYDKKVSEMISPYLGVGLGWSWVSVDLKEEYLGLKLIDNERDSSPSLQLTIGVGISVTPQVIIDVGYKYFWTGPIAIEGLSSVDFTVSDYSSNNFMVGVRYNF
jgi:opacity protein-like surface antigen